MDADRSDTISLFKSALAAAMIGFASATALAPVAPPRKNDYLVDSLGPRGSAGEQEKISNLPFFSGKPSDLIESDLGGIGGLVRIYTPKLLLPDTRLITVHNVSSVFPVRSGLFHVVDFDNYKRILRKDEKILFGNNKTFSDILPIIENNSRAVVNQLIATCATELRDLPEPYADQLSDIQRALRQHGYFLVDVVQSELRQIRRELDIFKEQTADSMRVITETLDRNSEVISISKAIKGAPQRFLEEGVDEAIKSTATTFARLMMAALVG